MTTDKIYQQSSDDKPFRFNEDVAKVFPDMLKRSIPGYGATIEAIGADVVTTVGFTAGLIDRQGGAGQ